MTRIRLSRSAFLASVVVALTAFVLGCSDDATTTAQFTPSATAAAPGLVKLVERSHAGSRLAVDVVLFGPEPALDLFAFKFGVKNGNSNLVRFVPQPASTQTALVADAGQSIAINVDGVSDPSIVEVEVTKQGGGEGNGFDASSAVVIELVFDVQGSGTTTLTLAGLGVDQPLALNSVQAPIGAVTFDTTSAGVTGVVSGGGY